MAADPKIEPAQTVRITVSADPPVNADHRDIPWIPWLVIAVFCAVLTAIIGHVMTRHFPTWKRAWRVLAAASFAVSPIILLPLATFAAMEKVDWSYRLEMLQRPIAMAVAVGLIVCIPVGTWITKPSPRPNLPDVFE